MLFLLFIPPRVLASAFELCASPEDNACQPLCPFIPHIMDHSCCTLPDQDKTPRECGTVKNMQLIKIRLVMGKRFDFSQNWGETAWNSRWRIVKEKILRDYCCLNDLLEVVFVLKGFIPGQRLSNTTTHRDTGFHKTTLGLTDFFLLGTVLCLTFQMYNSHTL